MDVTKNHSLGAKGDDAPEFFPRSLAKATSGASDSS
jgi:hypothetical protein